MAQRRDKNGRFASSGGSTSSSKSGKASRGGRVVGTIGRESMVMRKKDTPEEMRAKVAAAGARARARRQKRS